jgi:hypothetical protein
VEGLDDATRERLRAPSHADLVDFSTYLPLLIDVLVTGTAEVCDRTTATRMPPAELVIATTEPDNRYLLTIGESVSLRLLDEQAAAIHPGAARLELPTEALMRLGAGRLDPQHTPAGLFDDVEDAHVWARFPALRASRPARQQAAIRSRRACRKTAGTVTGDRYPWGTRGVARYPEQVVVEPHRTGAA